MRLAPCAALAAGAALLFWAARELGWRRACGLTSAPRQAEDPRLVLGGPFRFVRHPEALGAILMLLGIAIARPSPGVCLAVAVAIAGALALAYRSERLLVERFGDAYRRYEAAVPFVLPRFSRRSSPGRSGLGSSSAGR